MTVRFDTPWSSIPSAVASAIPSAILVAMAAAALVMPYAAAQDAPTQPAAAQPEGFPLEALSVNGNLQFPEQRIVEASGLTLGERVTKADFDAARDRLLATGAFEEIGYEYKPSSSGTGYDLSIQVVETQPLYAIRFENLDAPEAELRATLRAREPIFEDRIPPNSLVMSRYSAALGAMLGIEVIGEVNADTPGELMVVFRPEGRRANIARVDFAGNDILPASELRRAISEAAIGAPYSEPLFRQMLDAGVRPLYEERGRVRVAFTDIATAPSAENRGIVVTVTVDEGDSYTLGEVRFEGATGTGAGPADIERTAGFKTGDIANFTQIREGLGRIRDRFQQNGYLRVETPFERQINDEDLTVDLTVSINAGPQYKMGSLTIDGLDILSEPVIRKMWQMPEGSPYREGYADAFIQSIVDQGVFDNLGRTGAEAEIDDQTLTVHVILTFLGANVVPENERVPRGRR